MHLLRQGCFIPRRQHQEMDGTLRPSVGEVRVRGRVAALLVDTGYPADAMPLAAVRRLLPCTVRS